MLNYIQNLKFAESMGNNQQSTPSPLTQNTYFSSQQLRELGKSKHSSAQKFGLPNKQAKNIIKRRVSPQAISSKLMRSNKLNKNEKITANENERNLSYFVIHKSQKKAAEENPNKMKQNINKKSRSKNKQGFIQLVKTDKKINNIKESMNRSRSSRESQKFCGVWSPENRICKENKNRIGKESSLSQQNLKKSSRYLSKQGKLRNVISQKKISIIENRKSPFGSKIKAERQKLELKSSGALRKKQKTDYHHLYFKKEAQNQQKYANQKKETYSEKNNKISIPLKSNKITVDKKYVDEMKKQRQPTPTTLQSAKSHIENIEKTQASEWAIISKQKQYSLISGSERNLSKMTLKEIQSQLQIGIEAEENNVYAVIDESIIIQGMDQSRQRASTHQNAITV